MSSEEHLGAAQQQIKELELDNRSLLDNLQDKEKELESIKAQHSQQKSTMTNEEKKAQDEKTSLKNENADLRQQLKQSNDRNKQNSEKVLNLENQIKKFIDVMHTNQEKYKVKEKKYQEQKGHLTQQSDAINQLQTHNNTLEVKVNTFEDTIRDLENQLIDTRNELQEVTLSKERFKNELKDIQTKYDTLAYRFIDSNENYYKEKKIRELSVRNAMGCLKKQQELHIALTGKLEELQEQKDDFEKMKRHATAKLRWQAIVMKAMFKTQIRRITDAMSSCLRREKQTRIDTDKQLKEAFTVISSLQEHLGAAQQQIKELELDNRSLLDNLQDKEKELERIKAYLKETEAVCIQAQVHDNLTQKSLALLNQTLGYQVQETEQLKKIQENHDSELRSISAYFEKEQSELQLQYESLKTKMTDVEMKNNQLQDEVEKAAKASRFGVKSPKDQMGLLLQIESLRSQLRAVRNENNYLKASRNNSLVDSDEIEGEISMSPDTYSRQYPGYDWNDSYE